MRLEDMTPIDWRELGFGEGEWRATARAVGWLEAPSTFPKGPSSAAFRTALARRVADTMESLGHMTFRGCYDCTFCAVEARHDRMPPSWSQQILFVAHPELQEVYVAPSGVLHYVEAHGYLPPATFVSAVERCPPAGSADDGQWLARANFGAPPPLQSKQQVAEAWALRRARVERFVKLLGRPAVGASRHAVVEVARRTWPAELIEEQAASIRLDDQILEIDSTDTVADIRPARARVRNRSP